jgi:hypothetical protein
LVRSIVALLATFVLSAGTVVFETTVIGVFSSDPVDLIFLFTMAFKVLTKISKIENLLLLNLAVEGNGW